MSSSRQPRRTGALQGGSWDRRQIRQPSRSADFQSAVSRVSNLRASIQYGRPGKRRTVCRLQIGDTAQRGQAATKVCSVPVRLPVAVAACPRCAVCIWPSAAPSPNRGLGTWPPFGRNSFMQTKPLPEDLVPKSFMDQFGSLIQCALGGWDRLRFHASLRPLFSPQWMRTYLCAAKVRLTDFAGHAKGLTHRLLAAGSKLGHQPRSALPVLALQQDQQGKTSLRTSPSATASTAASLRYWARVEPCLAMTVRGARDRHWLQPVREQRKCLHLYHYYEHPVVGRCHVRLQTWYPFSVDVCLNGRLWLAKQMDAAGLAYQRADNCFIALADPARLKRWPTPSTKPLGWSCSTVCWPRPTPCARRFSNPSLIFSTTGRSPRANTPPTCSLLTPVTWPASIRPSSCTACSPSTART